MTTRNDRRTKGIHSFNMLELLEAEMDYLDSNTILDTVRSASCFERGEVDFERFLKGEEDCVSF
jgi:hypothetical protein